MPVPTPDFIICLECETPCYVFDWSTERGLVISALCEMCGNDGPEAFASGEEESAEEDSDT